jgi:hypothetical protein
MSIGGLVWGSGWGYMQFLKHKQIQMGLLKSFYNINHFKRFDFLKHKQLKNIFKT